MSLLLLVTNVFFHNKIYYLGSRISFLSKQKTELNNVDIMCSAALYSNSLWNCYLSYLMSTLSSCTWSAAEFDSFNLINVLLNTVCNTHPYQTYWTYSFCMHSLGYDHVLLQNMLSILNNESTEKLITRLHIQYYCRSVNGNYPESK